MYPAQLGAGPGTALVMSLLVVIGTLLPLIEDHADDAGSPAALVTLLGLLFAISGFVSSGPCFGTGVVVEMMANVTKK